jgi:preprotein translocase subunit SecG
MFKLLLILHAFIAILLIMVVIIQPGRSEEGGVLGGGTSTAFGTETVAVLTKTTAILGAIFMMSSLFLSIAGSKLFHKAPIVQKIVQEQKK